MAKPKGSGFFATFCGVIFACAFVGSFFIDVQQLTPERIMRTWFLFIAAILIGWGWNRIRTGSQEWTVGQDTINFVISLVGATIALLAFLKGSG
ncbi:MAG: hypothetical protein SH818_13460 [Saprospiraceae bacterium]|nr:hypothetical protein [Saprospiraceae bacterium]